MHSLSIATCTVSLYGYHEIKDTSERLKLLAQSVSYLSKRGTDIFVLPGGYLFSENELDLNNIKSEILKLASETGIDLLVGVDMKSENNYKVEELVKRGKLGSFSIHASNKGTVDIWRQRTVTRKDQYFISDDVCKEERIVKDNPRVECIICGEIFNQRIRANIVKRKTSILIDQAHISHQFRISGSMILLANQGVTSLCSVHANKKGAVKYCYCPDKTGPKRKSSTGFDLELGKRPRIEIKIWRFDSEGKIID